MSLRIVLLTGVICLHCSLNAIAQKGQPMLFHLTTGGVAKGIVLKVSDSTVYLDTIRSRMRESDSMLEKDIVAIERRDVVRVKNVERDASGTDVVLVCTLVGAAGGGLVGAHRYNSAKTHGFLDPGIEFSAIIYAIPGAVLGIIIGSILSSAETTDPVDLDITFADDWQILKSLALYERGIPIRRYQ